MGDFLYHYMTCSQMSVSLGSVEALHGTRHLDVIRLKRSYTFSHCGLLVIRLSYIIHADSLILYVVLFPGEKI